MNCTTLEDICKTFARLNDVTVDCDCYREYNIDAYSIRMAVGNRIIKQQINAYALIQMTDPTTTITNSLQKMLTMLTGETETRAGHYGGLICSYPSANVKIAQYSDGMNVIEYSGAKSEYIPYKETYIPPTKTCTYCKTKDSFNKHLCTQCGAPEDG